MWNYIRRKLGLRDIEGFGVTQSMILNRVTIIEQNLVLLRSDLVSTLVLDEQDPRRQSVSQELGDQIIKKMLAEDKARKHTLGEL